MPFVEHAGVKIYWEARGDGEPVMLITGLGAVMEQWWRLAPALSAGFRTIAFDNRGMGHSDVPPGPYSIEGMADDAAAVMEAAGLASAHVCGASMGGMIAQELMLRHPGSVRSLVLMCTSCGGRASVLAAREVGAALTPNPALTREEAFWAVAPYIYHSMTPGERLNEDLAIRLAATRTPEGYLGQLQAVRTWKGAHDRLGTIGVPTLIVHGVDDRLIPPDNAGILAKAIPGATMVMIPDAAHMLLADNLDATRAALLAFLEAQ